MACLFVDELTTIDFSYLHTNRGLVGETWLVDVELHGELDQKGFVFDFSKCKKTIKSFIDDWVDHKLVVPTLLPKITTEVNRQSVKLNYQSDKIIFYQCPQQALCLVEIEEITPKTFAPLLEKKLITKMPKNVSKVKVILREEKITTPYYHYSHGLKQHDGNCQRMAHGHRSKIEILENDITSEKWMRYWSERLKDIYIGNVEDKISEDAHYLGFKYESSQGLFEIKLPKDSCYLIEGESTVEHIAEHIAKKTKNECLGSSIKVRAYEGYKKGSQYSC